MKFFCMAYSEALGCYNFYIVESNWAIGVGEKNDDEWKVYAPYFFLGKNNMYSVVII